MLLHSLSVIENVPSGLVGIRVAFHQEDCDEDNADKHAETDKVTQIYGDEEDQGKDAADNVKS